MSLFGENFAMDMIILTDGGECKKCGKSIPLDEEYCADCEVEINAGGKDDV
ncbi:MAG: hypothetical protein LBL34_05935 [Clostridiales bacterium]|jgi:predicted amidophosphoribosyltransferase|nr:hypothetical protein [Clostridiales bacterium]